MARWEPLDLAACDPDPMVQFRAWFDEGGEMPERDAVALATADAAGRPSVRMVLLRHVDATSVGWYTNYESHKGLDLAANPTAALLWYCEPRGRQVRFEGPVAPASAAASDAYFAGRPRGHQVGAHASPQSRPIPDRAWLERRAEELEARFADGPVPRPTHWGGYRLAPTLVEFFQQRPDRLHDRVVYLREGEGWRRERWAP